MTKSASFSLTLPYPILSHQSAKAAIVQHRSVPSLCVVLAPGDIPADFGKLRHLQSLILEGNKLAGELPVNMKQQQSSGTCVSPT